LTVKPYNYSKTLIAAFILLTSVILTPPEYVQCDSIFPDETLDLYGIPEDPTLLRCASVQSAFFIFDFFPQPSPQQWVSLEIFSPQRITLEVLSSAILRC